MRTILLNLVLVLLLSATTVSYAEVFPDPTTASFPARAFQEVSVSNPEQQLGEQQRAALACFVLATEEESQRRYRQSYLVPVSAPIVQLIRSNFPAFETLTWERKGTPDRGFILLSQLAVLVASDCQSPRAEIVRQAYIAGTDEGQLTDPCPEADAKSIDWSFVITIIVLLSLMLMVGSTMLLVATKTRLAGRWMCFLGVLLGLVTFAVARVLFGGNFMFGFRAYGLYLAIALYGTSALLFTIGIWRMLLRSSGSEN